MGSKDTRTANGASGKTDLLLFDPSSLVIVEDEGSALRDDRAKLEYDERLVLSMMVRGVLQPIIVRKNPETDKVEVVDGRQRVKAAREANKRLRKEGREPLRVPAVVKRTSPLDSLAMMVTANELRTEDTPMNRAKKLARFLDMGGTKEDAATAFGCSAASIGNMLTLLDAPAVVRKAVEAGHVSVSDGYKLAKLEPADAAKRVSELKEHAPRTPGKKRSKNAKKAREIVSGKKIQTPSAPATEAISTRMENRIAKQIAAWVRATWDLNEGNWGGSPKDMADRIEKGEWREVKVGEAAE
jgi:ParB family transcriptional regulator, chromosome partitioning protein